MSEYLPDKFVVVKIGDDDKAFFKVLGSWYGGYASGNSWRMNSGITTIELDHEVAIFHGNSGSTYACHVDNYGTHMVANGILQDMQNHADLNAVEFIIYANFNDASEAFEEWRKEYDDTTED